ncbi:hypothetical protein D3C84_528860 [compost metagenome]
MFSPIVPSNNSMSWGRYPTCAPSSSLCQLKTSAPSRRTLPCWAGQMPSRARAKVDLPAPLEPMMPTDSPAATSKLSPRTAGSSAPGGVTVSACTATLPCGVGRGMRLGGAATSSNNSFRRTYCVRAVEKPFHTPIIRSMGASALPSRIDPAIISPGLISCSRTR